ncbi:MAG: acetyl-CoA carboxylase, biotin carboxyl carrier protein, partial [bacterium]
MPAGKLDKEAIRELAEILKETDLSEIEYEASGVKIRVARQIVHTSVAPSMPVTAIGADVAQVAGVAAGHAGAVKSPMVGTVYLSP